MPFLGARGQASRGYFGGGTTPDAPTSLVATRGNTEISVAFSAPAFNGGLDITNYEYSLNAGSTWTALSPVDAASPVLITGLSNGTTYTVYLRAVNALGSGTTSAPANAVTPAAVPGPPGTPTATTCQNLQSALSWTAAASNGSAVTDYVVEYSTSATFASAVTVFADGTSASTTATVTGLNNGTTYYFRVKATNAVGTGTYSDISTATTPATVPGAPTSVAGTACANAQSSVSWVAPASNGGDAVASYTVEYSTSATFASAVTVVSPTSTSSPKVVTGLTNGTTYYFRVKANNCAGSSSYSTISAGVIPATVPNAPTSVDGTAGDGQSSVSWVAPSNGGDAVDYYTVQYSTSATFASAVTTVSPTSVSSPKIVDGLSNGTPYYFRVKATNCAGDSSYSTISASVVPYGVASAPTIGTITTSINSPGTVSTPAMTDDENNATFTWSSPGATGSALSVPFTAAFDGGRSISDYEYSTDNGATFKSAGTITSPISITTVSASSAALVAGTAYTVKLRAVTIFGSGTASTGSAKTTPTAVTSYTIKVYDNYPTNNELIETVYENTTGTLSRSHFKLERDWSVIVAAVNTNGTGADSTESSAATGWRYSSYNADYSRTRSCESGTGCDSCGTKTGTEDGTVARDCYQWTRAGSTSEQGLACVYRTVPGGTEEQNTTWQGNCRDLEASCSDSWTAANPYVMGGSCVYATGVGTGVTGHYVYNALGGGFIRYTDGGCTNTLGCGSGYLQGTSDLRYCSTSGLYRAYNDDCVQVSI